MQTNYGDGKQNSSAREGGGADLERGITKGSRTLLGGWAFHSLDLVMVMSKPTKVYVLNMCSLSYVEDASMTLFLDKD